MKSRKVDVVVIEDAGGRGVVYELDGTFVGFND
jgi:hypothetical protein